MSFSLGTSLRESGPPVDGMGVERQGMVSRFRVRRGWYRLQRAGGGTHTSQLRHHAVD